MGDEALHPQTRLRAALMPLRRRKGIAHRHVKTIFEHKDADPRLRPERGEGHDFRDCNSQNFCDLCGQVIWGIFKRGLRCTNCKVTCHTRCREAIQLDCQHQEGQTSFGDQQEHPPKGDGKPARMECQTLTREEIEQMIKVYNSQVNNKFGMELLPDSGFTGFIKVQMHLQRPVSVAGAVGTAVSSPSLNDTGQRTTFYLPRGTEKQVHLSNLNMAGEVISALLHKFHVLDNPRKFALFQCSGPASCMTKRKLEDEENPLHLRLLAGPDMTATRFVLQENETGEVIWDAFTIPELHNFLLILEREEKTYVQKVQEKYSSFQEKLQEALATRKPG